MSIPEEWSEPGYVAWDTTIELMNLLIARRRPCRICRITEDGFPWIEARIRGDEGQIAYHHLGIYERTGWVRVKSRLTGPE